MAVPCEKSIAACAELSAESFEEGFEKSSLGISFFSPTLLNYLLERQKGSNQSGKQKLSSLQGNEVWLSLPVRAMGRSWESQPCQF